jgi:hypothetical protein
MHHILDGLNQVAIVHAIKAYSGKRDKAVLILNLGNRWRGSGQLHSLANLNVGKTPHFASKTLGESQRQFGYLVEEKSAIPTRNPRDFFLHY